MSERGSTTGESGHEPDVVHIHEPIYRELAEPRDGHEPTPTWLVFFAMALLGWGGWYLGTYDAGFDPHVYDASEVAVTKARTTATAPAPLDPMVLGKRVFNNCMACHQQDGKGVPGTYPPLAGSEWVAGRPEVLARIVLHGIQGSITVRGETYNNDMPAWDRLGDDQLAAVLTYVRASWGNDAAAVSPEVVTAARRATADRRKPWTAAELTELERTLPATKSASVPPSTPTAQGR
jgi:mono/diheme cytochrome c family protein